MNQPELTLTHSEALGCLAAAMVKVQAEILPAMKDSENPFFKAKYADLESVWDAIRSSITKQGLCVLQPLSVLPNGATGLVTMLIHDSGEWVRGEMPLYLTKQDPQGQGSAITYARRYCLASMVGVVQSDDDAESTKVRETTVRSVVIADRAPKLTPAEERLRKVFERATKLQIPEDYVQTYFKKKEVTGEVDEATFKSTIRDLDAVGKLLETKLGKNYTEPTTDALKEAFLEVLSK